MNDVICDALFHSIWFVVAFYRMCGSMCDVTNDDWLCADAIIVAERPWLYTALLCFQCTPFICFSAYIQYWF